MHRISCRSRWLRGFCILKFQSSVLNIYFRLSGFQVSLILIYFGDGPNRCSHYTKVWYTWNPSTMWRATFEIGLTQFRSVTEIASPQPFLSVNGSPICYDFREYSVRYIWASKDKANTIWCVPSGWFGARSAIRSHWAHGLWKAPMELLWVKTHRLLVDEARSWWSRKNNLEQDHPLKGTHPMRTYCSVVYLRCRLITQVRWLETSTGFVLAVKSCCSTF